MFGNEEEPRSPVQKEHSGEETDEPIKEEKDGTTVQTNTPVESQSPLVEKPLFQCEQCNKCLSTKGNLMQHLRWHTGDRPYVCDVCGMRFIQRSHLRTHEKKKTHSPILPLGCTDEDKIACAIGSDHSYAAVEGYEKLNKKFSCSECPYSTNHKGNLKQHLLSHSKERLFQCELCNKTFIHKTSLMRHLNAHTKDPCYVCDTCGKRFIDKSNFRRHLSIHMECQQKFCCSECPYSTNNKNHLKHHRLIHSKERPYQCGLCDKAFTHTGHLKTHLRVHTGERPYVCDTCGKGFSQKSNFRRHELVMKGKCHLSRHMEGQQTPDGMFRCTLCPYSTYRKKHYEDHLLTHTGERPFQCELCQENFAQKSTLNTHRRVHTGERPYVCDACGKGFRQKATFRRHELMMKGKCQRECRQKRDRKFRCTQCPFSADRKRNLKQHLLTHTGERPHQCELCDKAFTHRAHLRRHRLIHTGERPYVCDTCGKGFSQISNLRYHEVLEHEVRKVSQETSAFTQDDDPCAPKPSNELSDASSKV